MNERDFITRAVAKFGGKFNRRFRCVIIAVLSVLAVAVLLFLAISQRGVTGGDLGSGLSGLTRLIEFAFVVGVAGVVPLALCIIYFCSLEARLLRLQTRQPQPSNV